MIFAVVYVILHRRDPYRAPWERSLALAGAGFTGVWLLPFVRNPANPPVVGDPGTLGTRGNAFAGHGYRSDRCRTGAWRVRGRLAQRGHAAPLRQLAVTVIVVDALASLFALADNPDAVNASATLVWGFRLLSARL